MTPEEELAEINRILDVANHADMTAADGVARKMLTTERVAYVLTLMHAIRLQRDYAIQIWDEAAKALIALKNIK